MWAPGVVGFTETSALGIAGVTWDLMRIEAGCGEKKKKKSESSSNFILGRILHHLSQGRKKLIMAARARTNTFKT